MLKSLSLEDDEDVTDEALPIKPFAHYLQNTSVKMYPSFMGSVRVQEKVFHMLENEKGRYNLDFPIIRMNKTQIISKDEIRGTLKCSFKAMNYLFLNSIRELQITYVNTLGKLSFALPLPLLTLGKLISGMDRELFTYVKSKTMVKSVHVELLAPSDTGYALIQFVEPVELQLPVLKQYKAVATNLRINLALGKNMPTVKSQFTTTATLTCTDTTTILVNIEFGDHLHFDISLVQQSKIIKELLLLDQDLNNYYSKTRAFLKTGLVTQMKNWKMDVTWLVIEHAEIDLQKNQFYSVANAPSAKLIALTREKNAWKFQFDRFCIVNCKKQEHLTAEMTSKTSFRLADANMFKAWAFSVTCHQFYASIYANNLVADINCNMHKDSVELDHKSAHFRADVEPQQYFVYCFGSVWRVHIPDPATVHYLVKNKTCSIFHDSLWNANWHMDWFTSHNEFITLQYRSVSKIGQAFSCSKPKLATNITMARLINLAKRLVPDQIPNHVLQAPCHIFILELDHMRLTVENEHAKLIWNDLDDHVLVIYQKLRISLALDSKQRLTPKSAFADLVIM